MHTHTCDVFIYLYTYRVCVSSMKKAKSKDEDFDKDDDELKVGPADDDDNDDYFVDPRFSFCPELGMGVFVYWVSVCERVNRVLYVILSKPITPLLTPLLPTPHTHRDEQDEPQRLRVLV
jgi:hypothetical protein